MVSRIEWLNEHPEVVDIYGGRWVAQTDEGIEFSGDSLADLRRQGAPRDATVFRMPTREYLSRKRVVSAWKSR
jgi:hypothetical protein